jgi:UDP-glucose 4-epimerase
VVAIFSSNLAEGRPSKINGSGEQTRDYVYVRDVAKANVLALENEVPSGAYNVGTGVETSVNELYDRMCQLSGRDLLPQRGPQLPGEQRRSCVDSSRAARALNWWPEVDLDMGLKESLHFFAAL